MFVRGAGGQTDLIAFIKLDVKSDPTCEDDKSKVGGGNSLIDDDILKPSKYIAIMYLFMYKIFHIQDFFIFCNNINHRNTYQF